MQKLYDRADIYDLIESDRRTEIIREDWKVFLGDRKIDTLLDVSIGSGGMTLPLHELGIEICGSDLSEAMLGRCQSKAAAKGKPIELKQCDFRDLSAWDDRLFDCVASTGNSLAYVNNDDVLKALGEMDSHVKPGGYICFDSRNWEKIQRERQRFYFYNPFFHGETRVNLVQVWDHNADGSITFNLLYSFERDNKVIQREVFEEHYNPFPIGLARDRLMSFGYANFDIRPVPTNHPKADVSEMEWYRIIAQKKH